MKKRISMKAIDLSNLIKIKINDIIEVKSVMLRQERTKLCDDRVFITVLRYTLKLQCNIPLRGKSKKNHLQGNIGNVQLKKNGLDILQCLFFCERRVCIQKVEKI